MIFTWLATWAADVIKLGWSVNYFLIMTLATTNIFIPLWDEVNWLWRVRVYRRQLRNRPFIQPSSRWRPLLQWLPYFMLYNAEAMARKKKGKGTLTSRLFISLEKKISCTFRRQFSISRRPAERQLPAANVILSRVCQHNFNFFLWSARASPTGPCLWWKKDRSCREVYAGRYHCYRIPVTVQQGVLASSTKPLFCSHIIWHDW